MQESSVFAADLSGYQKKIESRTPVSLTIIITCNYSQKIYNIHAY